MLVLTRKSNQSFMIGEDIEVVVLQIKGNNVKLGISAPKNNPIYRKEIYEQIKEQNKMASMATIETLGAVQGLLKSVEPAQVKKKINLK